MAYCLLSITYVLCIIILFKGRGDNLLSIVRQYDFDIYIDYKPVSNSSQLQSHMNMYEVIIGILENLNANLTKLNAHMMETGDVDKILAELNRIAVYTDAIIIQVDNIELEHIDSAIVSNEEFSLISSAISLYTLEIYKFESLDNSIRRLVSTDYIRFLPKYSRIHTSMYELLNRVEVSTIL